MIKILICAIVIVFVICFVHDIFCKYLLSSLSQWSSPAFSAMLSRRNRAWTSKSWPRIPSILLKSNIHSPSFLRVCSSPFPISKFEQSLCMYISSMRDEFIAWRVHFPWIEKSQSRIANIHLLQQLTNNNSEKIELRFGSCHTKPSSH